MDKIIHECARPKWVATERDGVVYVKCRGCGKEAPVGYSFAATEKQKKAYQSRKEPNTP